MKKRTAYICEECGYQSSGHLGKCPECNAWGSIKEVLVEDKKTSNKKNLKKTRPILRLQDVKSSNSDRISTTINEFNRVIKFLNLIDTSSGLKNKIHLLSNMALLGGLENTVLSNSIFEVKRKEILRMDAEGKYIPLCTKNLFLKYHNVKDENFLNQQLYFWSENDRKNYLSHINLILSEYLEIENLSPITESLKPELVEE